MVNIRQNICPASKWSIKCPYAMAPEFIVIHNTANDASAANEITYMNRNNNYTSYHFAVDDVEVVQGLPLDRNGWHAGDGANGRGNRRGIAIEICYSLSGGARFDQAERNTAWLTAKLLKERGWGVDRVKKHQDFMNKYCPHRTLDYGWQRFLDMAQAELNKLNQPVTPPTPPATVNAEITYEALPKMKIVELARNANLWNFNFTKWGETKAIKSYNQGEKIGVVAIAHNKTMNADYYMTDYSWNNGNIRATNGFNVKDCQDYIEPTPNPPEPTQSAEIVVENDNASSAHQLIGGGVNEDNQQNTNTVSGAAVDAKEEEHPKAPKNKSLLTLIIDFIKSIFNHKTKGE